MKTSNCINPKPRKIKDLAFAKAVPAKVGVKPNVSTATPKAEKRKHGLMNIPQPKDKHCDDHQMSNYLPYETK